MKLIAMTLASLSLLASSMAQADPTRTRERRGAGGGCSAPVEAPRPDLRPRIVTLAALIAQSTPRWRYDSRSMTA